MYPESTTDSPARLSHRQTGSPGMIYSARYGSPKRQLQFYRDELMNLDFHVRKHVAFLWKGKQHMYQYGVTPLAYSGA
ncbi:hypothetical protein F2P81_012212 [Scophthalmus maximus]|uniref:Uncharacterized protein n=1 Tax=Scophthalmus maximus TaxID=52904 RepID=A0A6A4STT4_SCOMX|nr:hypothetical protein F2P81_012212 [Scophthalmus maximus]